MKADSRHAWQPGPNRERPAWEAALPPSYPTTNRRSPSPCHVAWRIPCCLGSGIAPTWQRWCPRGIGCLRRFGWGCWRWCGLYTTNLRLNARRSSAELLEKSQIGLQRSGRMGERPLEVWHHAETPAHVFQQGLGLALNSPNLDGFNARLPTRRRPRQPVRHQVLRPPGLQPGAVGVLLRQLLTAPPYPGPRPVRTDANRYNLSRFEDL